MVLFSMLLVFRGQKYKKKLIYPNFLAKKYNQWQKNTEWPTEMADG